MCGLPFCTRISGFSCSWIGNLPFGAQNTKVSCRDNIKLPFVTSYLLMNGVFTHKIATIMYIIRIRLHVEAYMRNVTN